MDNSSKQIFSGGHTIGNILFLFVIQYFLGATVLNGQIVYCGGGIYTMQQSYCKHFGSILVLEFKKKF